MFYKAKLQKYILLIVPLTFTAEVLNAGLDTVR